MRPTGRLHLGHYHGVIKNWVRLQHEYECYFFAADWHALTTGYHDTGEIERHTFDMVVDWLGGGRQSGRRDRVRPVEGAGACRAAPLAVDDLAGELAGARADLQGHAGEAQGPRPGHLRLSRLSRAAGGGHPHVPRRQRAGGGGPGRSPGTGAGDRAAIQSCIRPRARIRGTGAGGAEEDGPQGVAGLREPAQGLPGTGRCGGAGTRPGRC